RAGVARPVPRRPRPRGGAGPRRLTPPGRAHLPAPGPGRPVRCVAPRAEGQVRPGVGARLAGRAPGRPLTPSGGSRMAPQRTQAPGGGLVQEVCDHPGEDAPRLVYADWLEEHDQGERAQLIRVQIELARLGEEDPRRDELEWRAWELLVTRGAAWREALPTWV